MLSNYDKKVLTGISRFQPVSVGYLARVLNTPSRPVAIKKDRRFDVKYQLTNEMVSHLKQEKESDIEESIKRLIEKGKIVQSVPGYPKRYSVKVKTPTKFSDLSAKFDDDRLSMYENEYDDVDPEINKSLKEGFVVEQGKKQVTYPKPMMITQ